MITNLSVKYSKDDIEEIISNIGQYKNFNIIRDSRGRPTGTVEVSFHTYQEASLAVKDYDGAEVDNRIMYLSLKPVPRQEPPPPRQNFRQQQQQQPRGGRGGRGQNQGQNQGQGRRGGKGRGGRGRGRGGGGKGRGGRTERKALSEEELDKQLESYNTKTSGGAGGQPADDGFTGQPPSPTSAPAPAAEAEA